MAVFSGGTVEYTMSPACNRFQIKKTEWAPYMEESNDTFCLQWNLHPSKYKSYIANCSSFKDHSYTVNHCTFKCFFNSVIFYPFRWKIHLDLP